MTSTQSNFQPLAPGETYLTIIGDVFRIKSRQYVNVVCKCGTTKAVRLDSIENGIVKSCGCYKAEREKHKTLTRGGVYYQIYEVWRAIKSRCYNPKSISYRWYGAKGVTMCEDWKNNCDSFYSWAMSNGYKKGLQIDRINNDTGYYPENCRFVTPKENIRNNSTTVVVFYNGERRPLVEWVELYGLKYKRTIDRYSRGLRGDELFSPNKMPTNPPKVSCKIL